MNPGHCLQACCEFLQSEPDLSSRHRLLLLEDSGTVRAHQSRDHREMVGDTMISLRHHIKCRRVHSSDQLQRHRSLLEKINHLQLETSNPTKSRKWLCVTSAGWR